MKALFPPLLCKAALCKTIYIHQLISSTLDDHDDDHDDHGDHDEHDDHHGHDDPVQNHLYSPHHITNLR